MSPRKKTAVTLASIGGGWLVLVGMGLLYACCAKWPQALPNAENPVNRKNCCCGYANRADSRTGVNTMAFFGGCCCCLCASFVVVGVVVVVVVVVVVAAAAVVVVVVCVFVCFV